jgi:hypothetical protein
MLGCLGGSASGNENAMVIAVGTIRPKQMEVSELPLLILPALLVFVEALNRWRIRIPIVKIPDLCSYIDEKFRSLAHGNSIFEIVPGR